MKSINDKTMKRTFLLAFAACASVAVSAQEGSGIAQFAEAYLQQSTGNVEVVLMEKALGNTYIFGSFAASTTFGDQDDGQILSPLGNPDLFVVRYNPMMDIDLAFSLGRVALIDGMSANGIAVDGEGSIYICGSFSSNVNFNPIGEATLRSSAGGRDAFIAKYDLDGILMWVNTYGTIGPEIMTALDLGPNNEVYAAVRFSSVLEIQEANPDENQEAVELTSVGGADAALIAFDSDGAYQWHHQLGTANFDEITALHAHGEGVFVGAIKDGVSTPFLEASLLAKRLDLAGEEQWVYDFDNPGQNNRIVGFETTDDAFYVHGEIQAITDFDPDPEMVNSITPLFRDPFLAKYSLAAGELQWVRTMRSGGLNDFSAGVFKSGNNVWWAGSFDFEAIFEGILPQLQAEGNSDVFVAVYEDASGVFIEAKKFGATGAERLNQAYFEELGALTVVGVFEDSFGLDPNAAPTAVLGGRDGFVATLNYSWNLSNNTLGAPNSELLVYPNPANQHVFAAKQGLKQGQWKLYSVAGQLLKSAPVPAYTDRVGIDLSDVPAGIYILMVTDAERQYQAKLVKQ